MMKAATVALIISAMLLLASIGSTNAQTSEPADKVLQLANDFCSQLSRAQTVAETANDKASQLANNFCSKVRAESPQPTRLALAQASSQPTMVALAQPPGEPGQQKTFQLAEDLNISAGYKLWFTDWKTWDIRAGLVVEDEDSALAHIPTIGLRYKDFFVSASGLFAPGYNWSGLGGRGFGGLAGSRKEGDFNVGYYIHPWIGVSVGYKGVFQEFGQGGNSVKLNYNGVTSGVSVNVPIPEGGILPSGFNVYGTGAGGYMWVSSKNFAVDLSNHAFYGNLEGGIAYRPEQLPLVLTAGYRYQLLRTMFKSNVTDLTVGRKDDALDTLRGVILGVNLVF